MVAAPIVIGTGGASCSGKSTLSEWLRRILPNAHILHQDKFYKPDRDIPIQNGIANWDCPEALDMDGLVETLRNSKRKGLPSDLMGDNRAVINESDIPLELQHEWRKQVTDVLEAKNKELPSFIIVDGFLLYDDDRIIENFDIRLFLSASREVLLDRRRRRNGYITLEGFWEEPKDYFEQFVWPCYLAYNQKVLEHQITNIHLLDTDKTSIRDLVKQTIQLILGQL